MSAGPSRVPVTVVTGYLGAGKTTLVNHLLASHDGSVAVIENEFGSVGIDGELLSGRAAKVRELVEGCMCCASLGEFTAALDELADDQYDALIVETSGLASPGPVLRALTEAESRQRWVLDGLIAVVDAAHMDRSQGPELREQVAHASTAILNKADMAGSARLMAARETVERWNPVARVLDATHARIPAKDLMCGGAFDARHAAEIETHAHETGVHHHEHSDVDQVTLVVRGEFAWDLLRAWIAALRLFEADRLIRVKGVLAIAGEPRKLLLQGVHSYIEAEARGEWPTERRVSRVVLIGTGLDAGYLERSLRACLVGSGSIRPRPALN